MRSTQPRRGLLSRMVPKAAAVMAGFVGLIALLVGLEIIELPFLKKKAKADNTGKVPIPVSNQPIAAYTMLTRDHLLDPNSLQPTVMWVRPDQVSPRMLTNAGKLFGRVLRKEKPKGYAFTEEDFFPEKTRPGVVAGIPPGKRALSLDADKLKGIYSLRAGDHFDLLATAPVDDKKPAGGPTILGGGSAGTAKRANVKVLVQNGMVVVPATVRKAPEGAPKGHEKPGAAEIVIAANPEEIVALSAALTLKQDIVAIARSGRPDDPGESSRTPDTPPPPPLRGMEVLNGGKRQLLMFPDPNGPPREVETPGREEKPKTPEPKPVPSEAP